MNKSELIDAIALDTNSTKVDTARFVESFVKQTVAAVAAGDSVALIGWGSLKPVNRAAREGKNPKTGEKLSIAATVAPKFSAGSSFKAAVAAGAKKPAAGAKKPAKK